VTGRSRRDWIALGITLLVASVALVPTPQARADGDPASDFLVAQPVFFPFTAAPKPLERRLSEYVRSANNQGLQLRVAVIQSPHDLGSIPELFGKPALYARFLSAELHSSWTHRVLIVMPSGYGIAENARIQGSTGDGHVLGGLSGADRAVLKRLHPPTSDSSAAVVEGAITAVRALAARHDLHLTLPRGREPRPDSSSPVVSSWLTAAIAAMLGLFAGYGWYTLRMRRNTLNRSGGGLVERVQQVDDEHDG
jgi:hypothetical protein